jgi:hypothetical protein
LACRWVCCAHWFLSQLCRKQTLPWWQAADICMGRGGGGRTRGRENKQQRFPPNLSAFFLFLFFDIEMLAKFNPKKERAKLVEFTLEKKNRKCSQFLCWKIAKFRQKKQSMYILLRLRLCGFCECLLWIKDWVSVWMSPPYTWSFVSEMFYSCDRHFCGFCE